MLYEYSGAIHAHSNYSDGSGNVDEIVQAAREAELDYLILTDHNTLRAKREGREGMYGKTYLMVGYEINDKENKNHCLVFGTDDTLPTRLSAYEYLKIIKEQQGVTFIAHPNEKRNVSKEYPPYPWTAWDTDLFDGIEIWNHMSEWMEHLTEQNRYDLFLHPLKSIKAPDPETVEIWDRLNLQRRVPALGGIDAHAHKVNVLGFFEVEVFPYKVLFKSIRTHILLSHSFQNIFEASGKEGMNREIRSALYEGRSFVSNFSIADARGFRFFLEDAESSWQMGDYIPETREAKLRIKIPRDDARIRIIRNGMTADEYCGDDLAIPVNQPGAYRAEVFLNDRAWIFSNHIRYAI
jgi:hypothetical protein